MMSIKSITGTLGIITYDCKGGQLTFQIVSAQYSILHSNTKKIAHRSVEKVWNIYKLRFIVIFFVWRWPESWAAGESEKTSRFDFYVIWICSATN